MPFDNKLLVVLAIPTFILGVAAIVAGSVKAVRQLAPKCHHPVRVLAYTLARVTEPGLAQPLYRHTARVAVRRCPKHEVPSSLNMEVWAIRHSWRFWTSKGRRSPSFFLSSVAPHGSATIAARQTDNEIFADAASAAFQGEPFESPLCPSFPHPYGQRCICTVTVTYNGPEQIRRKTYFPTTAIQTR